MMALLNEGLLLLAVAVVALTMSVNRKKEQTLAVIRENLSHILYYLHNNES